LTFSHKKKVMFEELMNVCGYFSMNFIFFYGRYFYDY
jgi:hypothetical protein